MKISFIKKFFGVRGRHMSPHMNDYMGRALVPGNARESPRHTRGDSCEYIKQNQMDSKRKKRNYCVISIQD